MANKIESLRGMDDILPGEVEKWQWLEEKARIFFESSRFKEIRTPILEYTELFSRSVGEGSDIVRKEMFSFKDRGDRDITMRPEMTASVARSVIEKGLLSQAKSLRLYYIGPMFRAERPQAGRKRQFHQIGIEIINESGILPDLDALVYLYQFLRDGLGVRGLELRINDLGTLEDQKNTAVKLKEYFAKSKDALCEDCRDRMEKNVLRVFDCKNPKCQPVIEKAPWEEIAPKNQYFTDIQKGLRDRDIPFVLKPRLVRGLDYYNGLVFEISATGLGAQDALAGGGRYDRLYSDLGGKPTPCIGFSIGMERLLTVLEASHENLGNLVSEKRVYFIPSETNDSVVKEAAMDLRRWGMIAIVGDKALNKVEHFKKAEKLGAQYAVTQSGDSWILRDLARREDKPLINKDNEKKDNEKISLALFLNLKGIWV